ncbi:MAG: hypothetical protein R2736_09585 [Solirubrobacterales bacterium]
MLGRLVAELPHAWIETEIAHQVARRPEAADVADRAEQARSR